MPNGIVLFGAAVGHELLVNLEFDLNCPYAGCRLCGELYQSDLDRLPVTPPVAILRRERWRELHTKRYHTEREVNLFKLSGLAFTPEAAHRLAPFGIIPMTDAVFNEEVASALFEAPRAPINDVEG